MTFSAISVPWAIIIVDIVSDGTLFTPPQHCGDSTLVDATAGHRVHYAHCADISEGYQ
jgi:hypothetical protein